MPSPGQILDSLAHAALPFVRRLASAGIEAALLADPVLRSGLVLWHGAVSHRGIAEEAFATSRGS